MSDIEEPSDLANEEGRLSDFEKKYSEQMRQIVTQRLDLPISTLPAMLSDQIKLNPDFQRRDRWDEERQSRLIESLLMNVPIPPVFLGEDNYGYYVVLDGRQRLTAVSAFLSNTLTLKGLSVWSDLNGLRFADLAKRGLDKHVTRRFIPAVAILKESSAVVKYDVFDRLNTGGVKANDMEVRNAIFRGRFTETLHKVTRFPEFCRLWDIPVDEIEAEQNMLYQQMDDLLIALRFFALHRPENMEGAFKDYLGEFMEARNVDYEKDTSLASHDEMLFHAASINCWKIFGQDAFRNTRKEKKGPRSAPLSDALMIALSEIDPAKLTMEAVQKFRTEFDLLFDDADFIKSIGSGTNGKGAISTRIGMVRKLAQNCFA